MEILNELQESKENIAVALGYFDGVHTAHKKVIEKALKSTYLPCILTFKNNSGIVENKNAKKPIMSDEDKLKIFENMGIKRVYLLNFDEFKNIEANEFLDILLNKLNVKEISCGYDYKFGKKANGRVVDLIKFGKSNNVEIDVLEKMEAHNHIISSNNIRKYITQGDIESVNMLLGYRYFLQKEVVDGKRLGRRLGFPTINQEIDKNLICLKFGVYHTVTRIEDKIYNSITNVGVKPTVTNENKVLAETHIIGFEGDLYKKTIRIEYIKFLRPEQKFNSIDELKKAVDNDIETVKNSGITA